MDVNQVLVRRRGGRRAGRLRDAAGDGAAPPGDGEAAGVGRVQGRAAGPGRGRHARRGRRRATARRGARCSPRPARSSGATRCNDRFLLKSKALAGTMTTKAGTRAVLRHVRQQRPAAGRDSVEPRGEGAGQAVRDPVRSGTVKRTSVERSEPRSREPGVRSEALQARHLAVAAHFPSFGSSSHFSPKKPARTTLPG